MNSSLLFSGHMIDEPNRPQPRFPASIEGAVRTRIAQAIAPYAPGGSRAMGTVLGFASGARGGDILFHEQCQSLRIATFIVLPFAPHVFVETSVKGVPDSDWEQRFWRLWNATPAAAREVMYLPVSDEAYSACNEQLLERARKHGDVHLIALWDGSGGDGPGGTADLVAHARTTNEPDIFSPADLRPGA
jgi:hypothetical protein